MGLLSNIKKQNRAAVVQTALFVLGLALVAIDLVLMAFAGVGQPNPLHMAIHKASLVVVGATIGWAVDRTVDPDGKPDELRRGLILAAAILGMSLGL